KLHIEVEAVLDSLVANPTTPAHWLHQARYQKGRFLEKRARPEEALVEYLQTVDSVGASQPEELSWYYRSGFQALEILKSQKRWEAAMGLADRIAAVRGPRAEEAKKEAHQIRFQEFLYPRKKATAPANKRL
ncbi:MAG: hypothetical protein AAF492_27370, partial [Verrucomicrobiota bacterium]